MYDLDRGLELCGGMGRYQLRQLILSCLVILVAACQNLSIVFTSVSPKFDCGTNFELVNASTNQSFTSNDTCQRLANGTCSELRFDTSDMIVTLITKYELVCDRVYLVYLISTLYMIGFFLGSSIFGYLSDRFGRIKAMVASGIQTLVFSVIAALVPLLSVYMISRTMVAIGASGLLTCAITYMIESVITRYRSTTMVIMAFPWSVGFLLLCLISFLLRNQTYIELTLSGMCVSAALLVLLCHESPRWLLVTGQKEKVVKVMRSIAEVNGVDFDSHVLELISSEHQVIPESENKEQEQKKDIMKTFFKHPKMLCITIIVWYVYFVISLLFYGLSYGTTALGGWSLYGQVALGACIEFVFILTLIPVIRRVDRLLLKIIGFSAMAAFTFTITWLQAGITSSAVPVTVLSGLARALASFLFNVLTLYTVEVYPTSHRTIGVGFASASARVGAIFASQLVGLGRLWVPAPYLVYSCMALSVAFLLLLLPETRDRETPDTMLEAESLAKESFGQYLLRRVMKKSDHDQSGVNRSSKLSARASIELEMNGNYK